jgi:DNA-binding HxlR family transcriptional regulator
MNEKKKKVFYCNTELAIDIIGGKWKPLIIYHLDYNKVIRFGGFKRLIPNINERVLMRQLRELEENKIVNRADYNENPPRVEYSLTDVGKSVAPIINQLGEWGKNYNAHFDYGVIEFHHRYKDDF